MWGLIAIWAIGAVGLAVMINDDDDPVTPDTDTDPGMNDDEIPVGEGFLLDDAGNLTGTDQDDVLTEEDLATVEGDILDPVEDTETLERIDAGDGDDVIELVNVNDEGQVVRSSISDVHIDAGPGDDTITGNFQYDSVVDGGDGNDTIMAHGIESQIYGGNGDDVIDISIPAVTVETHDDGTTTVPPQGGGWELTVDGGEGNDLIVASNHSSAALFGGAGNDTIRAGGGLSFLGTNHYLTVDGGDGDDTIEYDAFTNVHTFELATQTAHGGEGADRFLVNVNEGASEIGDPCLGSDEPCDGYVNGHASYTDADETTLRIETLSLPDFEPGVDVLSLDATPLNDGYELTALALEESDDGESTDLILTYERVEDITRNVVITLGNGGVTWDDIEVEAPGDVLLEPLTVAITENDQEFIGSGGPETLMPDDPDSFYSGLYVRTGGGDDMVEGLKHTSSEVFLGAGADTFSGSVDTGLLDLGAGNDHADLSEQSNPRIIYEGGGFGVTSSESLNFVLDAGSGDDYVDVSNVSDGQVFGGAGDDVIIAGGADNADGTGHLLRLDGGEGSDTIRYAVTTEVSGLGLEGQSALGGEGADRFELTINEGGGQVGEPESDDGQVNSNAYYTDDGALRVQTFGMSDFEPSIDTLFVEASTQNDDYSLTQARLEEASDTHTNLVLIYESDESVTREIAISIGSPDVSWSDIEIVEEDGTPVELVA